MKKINLLVIAIIACIGMLGFSADVKAANTASISCKKKTIKVGETTNCTISLEYDSVVNEAVFSLASSDTLDISTPTPNTTAGWQKDATGTNTTSAIYAFKNSQSFKKGEVFSFNVTLNNKAKELGEGDNCGNLCIDSVVINDAATLNDLGNGNCYKPTIEKTDCPEPPCNPETGSFANYALILGSIAIAGVAVVIARKSSKFFRI